MRLTILLLLFLNFSLSGVSQINELVFKKFYPNVTQTHNIKKLSNGFVAPFGFSSMSDTVNIGVWSDYEIGLVDENTNLIFRDQLVFYDDQLNVLDNLPLKISGNNSNLGFRSMQMAFGSNFNTVLYFGNNVPSSIYYYDYSSGIYTPWSNFISDDEPMQAVFLNYNSSDNTIAELMRYTESYDEPYPGYYNASSDQRSLRLSEGQVLSILNGSTLISYLNLCGNQSLKAFGETMSFTSWNGQVNSLRIEMDLNSNEIITNQIGSNTGNLTTFWLQPSNDLTDLYRIGLVRGNNTPVSVSGSEIEMEANDSLYHVFITKEDMAGNTQWLTELYGYNNYFSDTITNAKFNVNNKFNLIESNEHLFVSSIVKAEASESDTMYYRNFLGETSSFFDQIPFFFGQIFPIQDIQISFSESSIFKLDEDGSVITKISHSNRTIGYKPHLESTLITHESNVNLFKVGNRLAWVNAYYAANDSIGKFVYTYNDGNQEIQNLELPSGKGVFVLWLDTDLNIVDNTIFNIEYTDNQTTVFGIDIYSILPYTYDTLMIEGVIAKNVYTNLDPNGNSSSFTTDQQNRFLAFYSTASTSVPNRYKNSFNIFPNPVNNVLHISELKDSDALYEIMDITGKKVINGKLHHNTIPLPNLKPGPYLISIKSKNGTGVQKFIIE